MLVDINSRETEENTLKKYKFLVIETLQREFTIFAETEDDAFDKIDQMHRNAEIVLDADDFCGYEIELIENPDDKEEE